MGEAYDTYLMVRGGKLARFPFGFWRPPEGFTRTVEIVRNLSTSSGVSLSLLTKKKLIAWGLESPLVGLFGGSTSRLIQMASVGIPQESTAEELIVSRSRQQRTQLSNAVMSEVWTRDSGKCVVCASTEDLEFDHVIPFSKGGASTVSNLRILCRGCNRGRGNRI